MTDRPNSSSVDHEMTPVREAQDATNIPRLQTDPADEDAKLDVGVDESFPASDPVAASQPGKGKDPAPSSGYDAALEERLAQRD